MGVIRVADRREAEALVRLINAAFDVERFFLDSDRIDLPEVAARFDSGVFQVNDEAGVLTACAYVELRGDRAYLGLLSVDPARQGGGMGRAMTGAAESYARERGCRFMDLRIVNLREELPPFYRKLGYSDIGESPWPADVPTKLPCHFIEMSKAL